MRYELVQHLADEFPVETLCAVLQVSRTAYYRYVRGASYQPTQEKKHNQRLVEQVFVEHKRRYGSRRITAELKPGRRGGARLFNRTLPGKDVDETSRFTGYSTQIVCASND